MVKYQVLHHSENFLAVDKMPDLVMNTKPGDERYVIVYRLDVMENWSHGFLGFSQDFCFKSDSSVVCTDTFRVIKNNYLVE